MVVSRARATALTVGVLIAAAPILEARGEALTIYEVQFNTNGDGASDYDGQVINCEGGIVVAKYDGFRPRLILQDPRYPDAWGGIQVKDWIYPYQMFDDAQVGDWIELTNMLVEEFRGTTLLQRQSPYNPGYAITTNGLVPPPPIIVSVTDIPAPLYDEGTNGWYVENHDAERYESMRLIVRDVTVTEMNLGKDRDNYNLQSAEGNDCWAADYMNEDIGPWDYHPFVEMDVHFCALTGVLEQYTKLSDRWDYYQLITTKTIDLAICGDGDSDGDVDLDDFLRFTECMTGPVCEAEPAGCNPPAWTFPPMDLYIQDCLMMDVDYDGDVDLFDFGDVQEILGSP